MSKISDYNSNNTKRLDLNGVIKILKKQRFIDV